MGALLRRAKSHFGMSDKKPTPNPLRWRESCPDCGFINTEFEGERLERGKGFTCPRCGVHYSAEDFHEEMEAKHQAQYHNHAKADLSQEEEP